MITVATVFLLGSCLHLWRPAQFPSPVFQLLAGGLMLGAVFFLLDVSDLFEAMLIARWTSITVTAACVLVLGKLCRHVGQVLL